MTVCGLAGRAPAQHVLDVGAAAVFQLEQLNVIYPTSSSAEEAERNRLSAERRAAFLRGAGVRDVRVRSDDRVSPEDLAGNLFLLGWSNRLLSRAAAAAPVVRTSEGIRFLGLSDPDPHVDLLFVCRSPYDREGLLFFWSRIDLELDRFMPLPNLGSHWALYRDYLPVRQGMFASTGTWPPERNPDAEKNHGPDLDRARAARSTLRGPHYTLRFDPQEVPEPKARAILDTREKALEAAAQILAVELAGYRATAEVYGDVSSKVALTGVPDAVHALARSNELHLLASHALSSSPHEEVHLLAHRRYGPAYLTAMYEGLALAGENLYGGMSLELHAGVLLDRQALPGLEDLLDEQRLRSLPDAVGFPVAGLLVRWIESVDRGAVGRAYGMWRGSLAELAQAVGIPVEGLETSFRGWVQKQAEPQRAAVTYLKVMARGREHYLSADYEALAGAMREALELKPDDPQALYNLAFAQARTGAYADAEQRLRRLLEVERDPRSRLYMLAHFELGRVYDLQGRREEALAQYRRVLEFPEQEELHLLAREAMQRPVTPDSLR